MAVKTQAGTIKVLWDMATVDIGSTLTLVSTDSAGIVMTGAVLGDPVILGCETTLTSNYVWTAFVSAADEVKIRFTNATANTIDPASFVFHIGVVKLVSYS